MKHINFLKRSLMPLVFLLACCGSAFAQPMSGVYTVYGTSPDFTSLSAAISALNSRGVSGPTWIRVRPGTYTMTGLTINSITGASATNRIWIESDPNAGGTTANTEIQNTNTSSATTSNFIFRFNSSKYITIQNLSMNKTHASYGVCVRVEGTSEYDSVNNCRLYGSTSTSTSTNMARIFGSSMGNTHDVVFHGNTIERGSMPIYWFGNSTSALSEDCSFVNNEVIQPYYYGGYLYYTENFKYVGNKVTRSGGGTFYGVNAYYCYDGFEYSNNDLDFTGLTTTSYPWYIYECDGSANTPNHYDNNNLKLSTTGIIYWYLYYGDYYTVSGNKWDISSTSYFYNYNYYGNNWTFANNDWNFTTTTSSTCYLMYGYGYSTYNKSAVFDNNKIKAVGTNAYLYCYPLYYGVDSLRASNNDVNMTGYYTMPLYVYANGADAKVYNNKIYSESPSYYAYGLYCANANNAEIFNNSSTVKSSQYAYGMLASYFYGTGNVYNNSICNLSTSTSTSNYTAYIYQYSYYGGTLNFYNNVVAKTSGNGRPPIYIYNPDNLVNSDYNNIYSPNGALAYFANTGVTYSSIASLRAQGTDRNSLSYEPGFTNASIGDLRPDPTNANSWSLNGRGIQIPGNNTDRLGNGRADNLINGVPDIGAYEFTPSVTPPVCVAAPASPTAGGTQVFTFGQDTVGTIDWASGASVPSTIAVRQYTGTVPPGLATLNPTNMYFYTDFNATNNSSYSFVTKTYYKDPWMGTIAAEPALRLAKKDGSNPWVGYAPAVSGVDVNRNFIYSPASLNTFGLHTGIDIGDNASADAITNPTSPFCPGTYTVKLRIKNNGNNKITKVKVSYQINGGTVSTINYNNTIDVNGSANGNEAEITLTNVTFANNFVNIKAWTHEPNGVMDPVPLDDTLEVNMHSALAGTYTVGGASPDFNTPVDAVTGLQNFGVCGNVIFDVRPGNYPGQLKLQTYQGMGQFARVTFRSQNGNANSVVITASPTSQADNGVADITNGSYYTLKNLTLTNTATSYGAAVHFKGNSSEDSILNCVLNASTTASTYSAPINTYNELDGGNKGIVIMGNTMNNGYSGIMWYNSTVGKSTEGLIIANNTLNNTYYYGMYGYYLNGLKLHNNTFQNPVLYYSYGLNGYYIQNGVEIVGNKWLNYANAYYGVYLYYAYNSASERGKFINNVISTGGGTYNSNQYYGMYMYYPTFMDIYNNTIVDNSAYSGNSYYAAYIYCGSNNVDIRNNAFIATGSHSAIGLYLNGSTSDYNLFYNTSTSGFGYYNGSSKSDFETWRGSSSSDQHSWNYEPGLVNYTTNPSPDPANPNSWSLNGRAIQINGNNKDVNGNPREDVLANGVPDIGAYEFEPTSIPPLATLVPAVASPGTTQQVMFGGNQIAEVKWNNTLRITAPLEVRQYSGRRAAGITTFSPASNMYFYTDVVASGLGNTYNFDIDVNYMPNWLGTIAVESDLKMAHKFGSNAWVAYTNGASSVNTGTDVISAPVVTSFGKFTGVEGGNIFSAFVKPDGPTVICYGDSVKLSANTGSGYTYQWKFNGSNIPGATASVYYANTPGDYTVYMTSGSLSAESIPITVAAVAPPMALINANGPLTFCTGGSLVLSAPTGTGLTYQWQLNGSDISGATNPNYTVNQPGTYTIKVENIGCESESGPTVVSAGPLVVDLGSDTSFCEVKNVPLVLDAGFPGAKYTWSTGDTTRSISPNATGDYWVEVDGGPNCVDRDTVSVVIDPLPSANGISYIKGSSNTYTFGASGAQNANGYLWIFSDGSTSTLQNPTKTITGDLYVRLVMFNACGSDTVQLGFPLNVSTAGVDVMEVSLYPNPASDQVTIEVSGGAMMSGVEVLNSVGAVVYRSSEFEGVRHSIPVSGYANGRYMLRATTSEGVVSKPFNIMR